MKDKYSIYEAKTHLSEILRQVRNHREVVITDRGKEVAKVVPLETATTFEKRIQALERAGVLVPATKPLSEMKLGPPRPGALERFLRDRHRY